MNHSLLLKTKRFVELFLSTIESIVECLVALSPNEPRSTKYKSQKGKGAAHFNPYSFSFRSEHKKTAGAFILSFNEITNQQIDFLRSIGMIQIPKTNKWRQSEAMAKIVTVKASNNADFKFKVGVVKKLGYRWNADDKVWAFDWAGSQGLV